MRIGILGSGLMGGKLGTLWLIAMAAGILADAPAHAQLGDDSLAVARRHRMIAFNPDRAERCTYFFVTEFSTSVSGVKSQDTVDRFLFSDALGLMWNVGRSQAVGLSIDAHLAAGSGRLTPTGQVIRTGSPSCIVFR